MVLTTWVDSVGDKSRRRGRFAETKNLKKIAPEPGFTRFFSLIQVADVTDAV